MNFSKALNIVKVIKDLSVTKQINKVRSIEKLPYYINLPAFESLTVPKNGRLLFQYNASLPFNFRIIDPIKQSPFLSKGILTIKYRVGSKVYRYIIWGELQITEFPTLGKVINVYDFEAYTNQLIGKNCCFEFWSIQRVGIAIARPNGIPNLKLKTSILEDPSNVNQYEKVLNLVVPLEHTDLGSTLPETIPTNQANLAWLNNVI